MYDIFKKKVWRKLRGGKIISTYSLYKDVSLSNIQALFEKRRLEEKHVVYSLHSATLKNERLKANLTLNEITEGICSKSYLSKIENNLLAPDKFVMKKLFERVNINYDKLLKLNKIGNLNEIVNFYLFSQTTKIEEVYQQLNNEYFIIRESLIKLIYYLANDRLVEFSKEVTYVDEVKSSLSDYELLVLMFTMIEFYIKTFQFINAKKYLDIIDKVSIEDEVLKVIFAHQHYIVACNLLDHAGIFKYYNLLNNNNYYPLFRKYNNKLLYTYTVFDKTESLKILEDMKMDIILDSQIEDYYYAKCVVLSKLYRFEEMVKCILDNNLFTPPFIALFGYGVSCLSKMDRNIENLDAYKRIFIEKYRRFEIDYKESIHRGFIKLMAMEIEGTENYEIIDYLKNYINIKNINYQHHLYTDYFRCKYYKLLGEASRYKEVYLFVYDNFNKTHDLKFV